MRSAIVAPVGMIVQHEVDNDGNIFPKHGPAHDQSIYYSEENSVNNRLIKDDLPPLFYGFCSLRLLHYVHTLCLDEPNKHILMSKIDAKSAYRRGTMSSELESKSVTVFCGVTLLLHCLPFRGSHCPFYCVWFLKPLRT